MKIEAYFSIFTNKSGTLAPFVPVLASTFENIFTSTSTLLHMIARASLFIRLDEIYFLVMHSFKSNSDLKHILEWFKINSRHLQL